MTEIDPSFISPQEKRDYWPILRLVLIVLVVVLGGRWVVRNYPLPFLNQTAYLQGRQAENDRIMTFYAAALHEHKEYERSYPLNLIDALRPNRLPRGIRHSIPPRDAWDHPLRYFSDGDIFLLVSVGRDGEGETEEYHELRTENRRRSVCDDPDSDLVISDRGWHRRCEVSD